MTAPQVADRDHDIYGLYDTRDRLIYIGCSLDLSARLVQHEAVQWWWPQVAHVDVLATKPTQAEGRAEEVRLIEELRPRWNKRTRAPESTWTADEFMDVLLSHLIGTPFADGLVPLTPRDRRRILRANSLHGLHLTTEPGELLIQLLRGETYEAWGHVYDAANADMHVRHMRRRKAAGSFAWKPTAGRGDRRRPASAVA